MDEIDIANIDNEILLNSEIHNATNSSNNAQTIVKGKVICESCDKPIPKARLEVMPKATMCVPCLSGKECKTYKEQDLKFEFKESSDKDLLNKKAEQVLTKAATMKLIRRK